MVKYKGGPYSFRDSFVMGRVTAIDGLDVSVLVKSAYFPVLLTVTGETVTETVAAEGVVEVTMPEAGTFTIVLQEAASLDSPKTDTDSFSVTVTT